jgi:hypothetical protein
MHASSRPKTLTATVSTKHTPAEETLIKEHARLEGLTVSEWCRNAHLAALDLPPWGRVILSEILALRRILLGLNLELVHGSTVTEQRLRAIVEDAEATKGAMADTRLQRISAQQCRRAE